MKTTADRVAVPAERLQNMTNFVDKTYYQELAEQDPEEICRRISCQYNDDGRYYSLTVWNDEYIISPHESKISRAKGDARGPHDLFYFFIVFFLLRAKETQPSGQWISEKEIPGGTTFFRGPHEIPTHLISGQYDNNINAFSKRCELLQGTSLDMADAAFAFEITPNIPVAVLYWAGDEDFPAEAKILFDKTISEHLPPDVVFSLAVEICVRIGS